MIGYFVEHVLMC